MNLKDYSKVAPEETKTERITDEFETKNYQEI